MVTFNLYTRSHVNEELIATVFWPVVPREGDTVRLEMNTPGEKLSPEGLPTKKVMRGKVREVRHNINLAEPPLTMNFTILVFIEVL